MTTVITKNRFVVLVDNFLTDTTGEFEFSFGLRSRRAFKLCYHTVKGGGAVKTRFACEDRFSFKPARLDSLTR